MNQITITVARVEYPEAGKKQGKVHDTTGKKWQVWADKLQNYQPGLSYVIKKIEPFEYKGQTYYTIMESALLPGGAAPPQAMGQMPPPAPIAQQHQARQQLPFFTPKDEMIFVCGIINNMMSNPNMNPSTLQQTDLIQLVILARTAWRNTFGKSQSDEAMDDRIPF